MMGDGPDAGLPAVAGPNELNGTGLLRWGRICLEGLQQRREEINALNVFPIADADTGTNAVSAVEGRAQDGLRLICVACLVAGGSALPLLSVRVLVGLGCRRPCGIDGESIVPPGLAGIPIPIAE